MAVKLFPPENRSIDLSSSSDWHDRLWRNLLLEKLNTSWGYALGLMMSLSVAWIAGAHEASWSWTLLAATILLPAFLASFLYPRTGILLLLGASFLVMGAKRFSEDAPLGLIIDLWLAGLAVGVIYQQTKRRDWRFLNHPLTFVVAAWVLFCGLELLNPWSRAAMGWLYAFRPLAGWMALYFVALFAITRPRHIMMLHRVWVGFVVFAALYGLWQWWTGPNSWEYAWILADEARFDRLFGGNRFRVFSFFSDPIVLGTVSSITSVMVMILGWREGASWRRRIFSLVTALVLLAATLASGSKLALLLMPVGLMFYTAISLRKSAMIALGVVIVMGAGVLFLPIENAFLVQVRQAINPWSTQGFLLREQNQTWVQSFIWEHPIGAGLGKTGELGRRFAPDLWLSQFPPDSAYVRIAVEAGWLGLLLYLGLMFAVLWTGVRGLFRSESLRMKTWYQAYLTFAFLVVVGNFTQQLTIQLPIGLMFILTMAVMVNGNQMKRQRASNSDLS
ncbi:MAG: hypothetical protein NWR72_15195 [Bacteroidia bacterium]|nr:hypothetical protein [Bacteroidia bacterium]